MKRKVSFTHKDLQFTDIAINEGQYGAFVPMGSISKVVRQYMKQRYPDYQFAITTRSFSMGDAVDVYVDPRFVSREQATELYDELKSVFQYSYFDPMSDYSGIKESFEPISYQGATFDTKYMHVVRDAKWEASNYEEVEAWTKLNLNKQ